MIFYCKKCDFDFEIQKPGKKEYTDPVYGPCAKYVANCPKCNIECTEKPKRKPIKNEKKSVPLFSQGSCGCGAGYCR